MCLKSAVKSNMKVVKYIFWMLFVDEIVLMQHFYSYGCKLLKFLLQSNPFQAVFSWKLVTQGSG